MTAIERAYARLRYYQAKANACDPTSAQYMHYARRGRLAQRLYYYFAHLWTTAEMH
jgi:hypothetical protein